MQMSTLNICLYKVDNSTLTVIWRLWNFLIVRLKGYVQ